MPPIASEIRVIREAIRRLPVIAYALGIAAVGAAISVVRSFLPGVTYVGMFPIIGAFLVAMVVLLLVATAAGSRNRLSIPAAALVWAVCLFIIIFLGFTVTAIAAGWPSAWRELILPNSGGLSATPAGRQPVSLGQSDAPQLSPLPPAPRHDPIRLGAPAVQQSGAPPDTTRAGENTSRPDRAPDRLIYISLPSASAARFDPSFPGVVVGMIVKDNRGAEIGKITRLQRQNEWAVIRMGAGSFAVRTPSLAVAEAEATIDLSRAEIETILRQ